MHGAETCTARRVVLACLNMAPVSRRAFDRRRGVVPGAAAGYGALLAASVLCASGCAATSTAPAGLTALEDAEGVQLLDAGLPVLRYRSRPGADREPWRTDYVHPLYSVDGAIVTEDAPADHVHHRGIFWAWRRILVDGVPVADGWVGKGLVLEAGRPGVMLLPDGSARIEARLRWRVTLDGESVPIVEENSAIRAWPVSAGVRRVDVTVRLRALRPGVELAGTDDGKGYGGLSIRFANPQFVRIESGGRELLAVVDGMDAGPDVGFAWPTLGPPWPARIDVTCSVDGQPWTRWVLRQEPSMQNCAYPGRVPVALPTGEDRVLEASLRLR